MCLLEKPLEHFKFLQALDQALQGGEDQPSCIPEALAGQVPTLLKLMSTSRDRAVLQFVLASIYSNSNLHKMLGYVSVTVNAIKEQVCDFLSQVEITQECSMEKSEKAVEIEISKLEKTIIQSEHSLERKRKRLALDEVDDLEYELEIKRQRLTKLRQKPKQMMKRKAKRHFCSWKNSLKRQTGKNKGKFRIHRGAEQAVYEVLEEQLKAHRRRWGEEGTGYLESHQKRLHKRDMRRIANKYLATHKQRLIKSCETVRSWGKCRNKRSNQSKQHRGRNLWSFVRSQKNLKNDHINVHYNRVHIKNYTRLSYGGNIDSHLVVRRAMDDKAYIRCGTSEGFSRPLHRPVQVTDSHFDMPASDYPDTVGYVSPGVIMVVKSMKQVADHEGNDNYSVSDSLITATCKPKHYYSSSATNWQNDMAAIRYLFREEHEIEGSTTTTFIEKLPEVLLAHFVWLRDSLFQYELMCIPEDYTRIVDGGDHLAREKIRHKILLQRLKDCIKSFQSCNVSLDEYVKINEGMVTLQDSITKEIRKCNVFSK